jgi:hypothetical protein
MEEEFEIQIWEFLHPFKDWNWNWFEFLLICLEFELTKDLMRG